MPLTREEFLNRIRSLSVWTKGSERAPNKPLLLLYALGRAARGEARLVPYPKVHEALGELLSEFGRRGRGHPEYPFWYLQNDGLWSVESTRALTLREGKQQPTVTSLKENRVPGGFPTEVSQLLEEDPSLVREAATLVLTGHFPTTYHQDILSAVGLDLAEPALQTVVRRPRDPRFREDVIVAYERCCAICGFEVRIGPASIGLEAAHIRWHVADGPDVVPNGLALCAIHHKLLDRGAITISDSQRVKASELVNGGAGLSEWVLRFHEQPLRSPLRREYRPDPEFLAWHRREVFRGREREYPCA